MKRIVITGPESTGKSTLCAILASHYNTVWVPEYAREFLLRNGNRYTYNDLLMIARGQLELEDDYARRARHGLLFIDTDLYVMKVWCEFVFGKCHPWILDRIAERHYDLYLLCNADLPWISDTLREYPDLESRTTLFHMYRDALIQQHTPWKEIGGLSPARESFALQAVEQLLK